MASRTERIHFQIPGASGFTEAGVTRFAMSRANSFWVPGLGISQTAQTAQTIHDEPIRDDGKDERNHQHCDQGG